MAFRIPLSLASSYNQTRERIEWLARLPAAVECLKNRWPLTIGIPFEEASCAWVAPVKCANGSPAVLKVSMPHMEGKHEAQGLRFWNGEPTVRLIDSEEELGAMLLERCEPGTSLRSLPACKQDVVITSLLRRLWRSRLLHIHFALFQR